MYNKNADRFPRHDPRFSQIIFCARQGAVDFANAKPLRFLRTLPNAPVGHEPAHRHSDTPIPWHTDNSVIC